MRKHIAPENANARRWEEVPAGDAMSGLGWEEVALAGNVQGYREEEYPLNASLLANRLAGDEANVATADADVAQFAVGKTRQFVDGLLIGLPAAVLGTDRIEHLLPPSIGEWGGSGVSVVPSC